MTSLSWCMTLHSWCRWAPVCLIRDRWHLSAMPGKISRSSPFKHRPEGGNTQFVINYGPDINPVQTSVFNSSMIGLFLDFLTQFLTFLLIWKKQILLFFGSQAKLRKLRICEIFLDKIKIPRTDTAKFLGVVIDENLTWKNQINYIFITID